MREEHPDSTDPEEAKTSPERGAFLSIQTRLFAIILLVLIPILLFQAYFFYDRYQYRKGVELQANIEIARAVAKAFDAFVTDVLRQELAIGIAATATPPLSPSDFYRLLSESVKDSSAVRAFMWVSPQGRIIASSNSQVIGFDISDRPYFKEIVSGRQWLVTDLLGSKLKREEREPIFGIAMSVRDASGNLLGVVLASLVPSNLDTILAIERSKGAGVSLIDSKGIHVRRYPVTEHSSEQRDWLKVYPEMDKALKGKEFAATVPSAVTGERRLIGFAPVSSIGWVSAASRSEEETVGPIISATVKETGVILFVALASLLAAFGLARSISVSIKSLQQHALSLGCGETDSPVIASGPAELKDLASAFNTMAKEVQSREAALRESEERFRTLYEEAPIPYQSLDEDGRIRMVNQAWLDALGYSKEEVAGRWFGEFLTSRCQHGFQERFPCFKGEGEVRGVEFEMIRKGGRTILTSFTGKIGRDRNGRFKQTHCIFSDVTERKRAEEAMRLHLSVMETVAEGIFLVGLDDNIIKWTNRKFEEMFGYGPGEMTGMHVDRVNAPTHKTPTETRISIVDLLLQTGEWHGEIENIKKDTTPFWCYVHISLFDHPEFGKVMVSAHTDITEQKRMEEELRKAHDRAERRAAELNAALESLAEGVVFYDTDHSIIHINPVAAEILGFSQEEVKLPAKERVKLFRVLKEDGRAPEREELPGWRALQGEIVMSDELILFPKDADQPLHLLTSASPIRMADGQVIGAIQTLIDITQRKQMEEEIGRARDELELRVRERTAELVHANQSLQLDEARFEALYQLSRMSEASRKEIADYVLEHLVTLTRSKMAWVGFMNSEESATLVHSWSRHAMEECSVIDKPMHFPMEEAGIWAECIRKRNVMMVNDYSAPNEAKRGYPEGHVKIHRLLSVPVFDGDRIAAVGVVANKEEDYDSTDVHQMGLLLGGMWKHIKQKEASEELKVYAQKLQESNQALQDFASIASHDMQEPLRKVTSFGHMLEQKYGDVLGEGGTDYLQRMLSATDRMQSLLKSLLEYSRVSTRAEPFQDVDLSTLIREVLSDLEVRIEQSGGRVELGEFPTIYADPTQMRQLFQNLIGNGLKFHKEGKKPVVMVHYSGGEPGSCEIIVQDNGIGFEEHYLEKIFAPFQRLHGRTSSYEGTGMGLAICKKIVERHGGSITAKSIPGEGSMFILTLPLRQPDRVPGQP